LGQLPREGGVHQDRQEGRRSGGGTSRVDGTPENGGALIVLLNLLQMDDVLDRGQSEGGRCY
jgi:hypothetical protein